MISQKAHELGHASATPESFFASHPLQKIGVHECHCGCAKRSNGLLVSSLQATPEFAFQRELAAAPLVVQFNPLTMAKPHIEQLSVVQRSVCVGNQNR